MNELLVVDNPTVSTGEVRTVNETTGAEKGSKLARFDLIPSYPLWLLAEHYGKGALKYAERNWERGYEYGKSYSALDRHLKAYWGGQDIDPETGSPHLVAVAWHCFALLEYARTHPEMDDRSTNPTLAQFLEEREAAQTQAEGEVNAG